MIGSEQYFLSWTQFEKKHPDKRDAFERLSRSIFQRRFCTQETILHSDPNHPGVEVVPALSKDGKQYISFQAKYFDNKVNYAQIKESMKKAINNYKNKLNIIYLFCNKDIAETSKFYCDIIEILNEVGIDLKLITGQSILDIASEYPSILPCYFGFDKLDNTWFEKNLNISLTDLGKRYNSLFNIDTEAKKQLSIFLRDDDGINVINNRKKELLKEIKNNVWKYDEFRDILKILYKIILDIPDITSKTILEALNWKTTFSDNGKYIFNKLEIKQKELNLSLKSLSPANSNYNELSDKLYFLNNLLALPNYLEFQYNELAYIQNNIVFITGEMGTGKSQLLAYVADKIFNDGIPVLLFLGQKFISDENIEIQIMNNFEDIKNQSFESLLSVMNEQAYLLDKHAVIFIDAINESRYRDIWKFGLNRIIALVNEFSNLRLVISLRSGFEKLTLSENLLIDKRNGKLAEIIHNGFQDDSPNSIYKFLSFYNIPFSPENYLQKEMTNPLFLTWFCQTYSGEEIELTNLMEKVIDYANEEGLKEAGINESFKFLKKLLYNFIEIDEKKIVTQENLLSLSIWNEYGIINKISYIKAIERTGVLASYAKKQDEIFYIGYNLLDDYLKASRIINSEQDKNKIKKYCKTKLLKIENGKITNYVNISVFILLTVLYTKKFAEECLIDIIEQITDNYDKNKLINQYIQSFSWKSSYITLEYLLNLINKYHVSTKTVWNLFIENATKESSELNALGLTKLLNTYKINQRDYLWTTTINDFNEYDHIVSLAYSIESGLKLNNLSDNKAFLLLILFSWMLSSSNRTLRDRISKAMIEILKDKFKLCIKLLEIFNSVNDPYIIQRIYGIIFGTVMKRKEVDSQEFLKLAKWVYDNIFKQRYVYPDILLRDYARLIIERFLWEYPEEKDKFDTSKIIPPYKSKKIPKVKEIDYSTDKYDKPGIKKILFSMKFNLDTWDYGDFGRYTFQSALSSFINVDEKNIYYYALKYIFTELNYSSEYFGEYDQNCLDFDRTHSKKTERIGKKYQWIAMYNILARLSDYSLVKSWFGDTKPGKKYKGAWNPYVRDFDPTLNIKIKPTGLPDIELLHNETITFLPFNASKKEINEWLSFKDILFENIPNRIIHTDEYGNEWVSLFLYQVNEMKPSNINISQIGYSVGEQHIWTIASMHIVNGNVKLTIENLKKSKLIQNGVDKTTHSYSLFNREYVWSPGYKEEFNCLENECKDLKINSIPAANNFKWEEEYDASQQKTTSFMIPDGNIIQELKLYQKDIDGIYYYHNEIAAYDLSLYGNNKFYDNNKYSNLIIKRDILNKYMDKTNTQLYWEIIGEKQYFLGEYKNYYQKYEGYFIYDKNEIIGDIILHKKYNTI